MEDCREIEGFDTFLLDFHDKEIDITIKEAEEGTILRAFIANYNDTHVQDITVLPCLSKLSTFLSAFQL